jgi:hypothetical protein
LSCTFVLTAAAFIGTSRVIPAGERQLTKQKSLRQAGIESQSQHNTYEGDFKRAVSNVGNKKNLEFK